MLRAFRADPGKHLDRKQLLTHAAALLKRRDDLPADAPPTALLAVFWMPADAAAIPACRAVLAGVAEWAGRTADSPVPLLFTTVDALIGEWAASADGPVRGHAARLAARYGGIPLHP